jgi:internalin A
MKRICVALLLVVGVVETARSQPTPPAGPIDEEIVAAWEDAGGELNWLGWNRDLMLGGIKKTAPDRWPVFFISHKTTTLSKLPAPSFAFGVGLGGAQVKDAMLTELTRFENLHSLHLGTSSVTPSGFRELAKLKRLRVVLLSFPLTEEFAAVLPSLKEVKAVYLIKTKISNADMKELAKLSQLQILKLDEPTLKDVGLKHVSKLTELIALQVVGAQLTDAGLSAFASLDKLRMLDLSRTEVTDAGLRELAPLGQLQVLIVTGTKVSDAGVKELAKSLPNLKVYR